METDRLVIESPSNRDCKGLVALFTCPTVRKYLGGSLSYDVACERANLLVKVKPELFWVIRERDNRFVGTIALGKHHDSDEMEISYQLIPDAWGKGFAKEALEVIIEYLLKNLDLTKILAETQTKNIKSINLLNKLGFKEIRKLERFGEEQSLFEYAA